MLFTIQLYNESGFLAYEINDEMTNGVLSSELETSQMAIL